MSNNSKNKNAAESIYSIEKNINVFSEKDFRKEFESAVRNVFRISVLAFKVYELAQKKDKIEGDLVMLDASDICKELSLKNKTQAQKAIQELLLSGLLNHSQNEDLYCLENLCIFDEYTHSAFSIAIKVHKKETIEQETENNQIDNVTIENQTDAKINTELTDYLKENFSFTNEEIKDFKDSLRHENLTKKKFFSKIEEWEKAMRANTTLQQKKNYIAACLVNEEWL